MSENKHYYENKLLRGTKAFSPTLDINSVFDSNDTV